MAPCWCLALALISILTPVASLSTGAASGTLYATLSNLIGRGPLNITTLDPLTGRYTPVGTIPNVWDSGLIAFDSTHNLLYLLLATSDKAENSSVIGYDVVGRRVARNYTLPINAHAWLQDDGDVYLAYNPNDDTILVAGQEDQKGIGPNKVYRITSSGAITEIFSWPLKECTWSLAAASSAFDTDHNILLIQTASMICSNTTAFALNVTSGKVLWDVLSVDKTTLDTVTYDPTSKMFVGFGLTPSYANRTVATLNPLTGAFAQVAVVPTTITYSLGSLTALDPSSRVMYGVFSALHGNASYLTGVNITNGAVVSQTAVCGLTGPSASCPDSIVFAPAAGLGK